MSLPATEGATPIAATVLPQTQTLYICNLILSYRSYIFLFSKATPLIGRLFWDQFKLPYIWICDLATSTSLIVWKSISMGKLFLQYWDWLFSSENYQYAIDLLKSRSRNTETLISAHMETLLNLNKVRNFNSTIAPRKLYAENYSIWRWGLCQKPKNFECWSCHYIFIPILKARLPDALVMITVRKFGEYLNPGSILKYFHEELIAKEACFSYKRLPDK